jgi:hypothetical protein
MQDLVMLDEQGPGFDRRCSTSTPGDEGTVRLERLVDLATGPTELLMLASLAGERSPLRDPAASGAVIGRPRARTDTFIRRRRPFSVLVRRTSPTYSPGQFFR